MKTLFGVFVILLFCLSPLSVAGLNQGHDNNHTNINNSTSMKNDIKSINNPSKNMPTYKTKNNTKNQLSWPSRDENVDIFVVDVDYEQQPILHYKWNNGGFPFLELKFNISVTGVDLENKNYSKKYNEESFNPDKWESLKLDENLMPGKYKVTITQQYLYVVNHTYFTVRKLDLVDDMKPRIEINSENKPVVSFTRPKTKYDLNGSIVVYSPSFSKQYEIPIPKYESRIIYTVNETMPDPDIPYWWVHASYFGTSIYKRWGIDYINQVSGT